MATKRLVTMLTALALSVSFAQQVIAADDVDVLRGIVGSWGCSVTSPISALGPVAAIAQFTVDSRGHAVGLEVIASANPHVVVEAPVRGDFRALDDGTLLATLTVTFPDPIGDIEGRGRCVVMDREGERFREMHCVDIEDEPGLGLNTINHTVCKRQ